MRDWYLSGFILLRFTNDQLLRQQTSRCSADCRVSQNAICTMSIPDFLCAAKAMEEIRSPHDCGARGSEQQATK